MKSKPYSVLLLYPDYATSNYGTETYYAFVTAPTAARAVEKAQYEAYAAANLSECEDGEQEDFALLLVIEGHHQGLSL